MKNYRISNNFTVRRTAQVLDINSVSIGEVTYFSNEWGRFNATNGRMYTFVPNETGRKLGFGEIRSKTMFRKNGILPAILAHKRA